MISSSWVPAWSDTTDGEPQHLFARRRTRRHRIAVAVVVRRRLRGRKAHRAGVEGVVEEAFHLPQLRVAGLVAHGVVAHHDAPQRRMTAEESRIHRDASLVDPIQVVGERLPVPRHALLQRGQRDTFDARHQAREVVHVLVAAGREREAAVAAEHRRDAVQWRGTRRRIPEQLRVVVRVEVDESGRHHQAIGVERAGCNLIDVADLHDASVGDRDVGSAPRCTRAVHDGAVLDEEIDAHGTWSSSGTGWRKSLDAFSHVTLRMSASETCSRPPAARSCVSGHVESACG